MRVGEGLPEPPPDPAAMIVLARSVTMLVAMVMIAKSVVVVVGW